MSRRSTGDELGIGEEIWFHGILPRKGAEDLLRNEGDFVVRITETDPKTRTKTPVISLLWDASYKHLVIKSTLKKQYTTDEKKEFPSIRLLIAHYIATKEPLDDRTKARILQPVPKQPWELDRKNIQMKELLGEGEFGKVYKSDLKVGRKTFTVAVKTCRGENVTKEERQKFMEEARTMRQYDHPNIVRLMGISAQENPMMIVLEFVPGGSLKSHLVKNGAKLTEKDLTRYCLETAKGMEYLESKKCIHRDLAARNCLLGTKGEVKIADFGLSKQDTAVYKMQGGKKVPVKWLAPESLRCKVFTPQSDRWSYGVVMWEVFCRGQEPYPGMSNLVVQRKVVLDKYRMDPPVGTPLEIAAIMLRCWTYDMMIRPPFSQIVQELDKPRSRSTPKTGTRK